jgi:hypothetical protein
MIMLNGGSQKLQLCDSAGGGKIDASAYTGTKLKAIVRVNNGATFNMYGGILTGNKNSTIEGSSVFLTYKSIFNMYGGSITGNKTTHYGTVFVGTNTSSFTMYGGSISNNEVGRGGAVASTTGYAENARASITIKGGTIENNKAQYGGVIYAPVAGGKNNNGTITYNSTYGAKVTIEGGTCTPIAVLSNENTIVNLKNDVIQQKTNGSNENNDITVSICKTGFIFPKTDSIFLTF